ncbi:MAG: hypothetical protein DA328_09855 [Nitrososphaeraceae archaeon]|nr:hypothetical protein [Nitrososphaeraceae archaeon]
MNLKNWMIFAVLSFGIVALVMSSYNSTFQSAFIKTYAQENEAEVETDIEQENKCKKDSECENENELNNELSVVNKTSIQGGQSTEPTCEECFTILDDQVINQVVDSFNAIVSSELNEEQNIDTLEDLCEFLQSTVSYENEYVALEVSLSTNSVDEEQIDSILQCLVDLGLITPQTG